MENSLRSLNFEVELKTDEYQFCLSIERKYFSVHLCLMKIILDILRYNTVYETALFTEDSDFKCMSIAFWCLFL